MKDVGISTCKLSSLLFLFVHFLVLLSLLNSTIYLIDDYNCVYVNSELQADTKQGEKKIVSMLGLKLLYLSMALTNFATREDVIGVD